MLGKFSFYRVYKEYNESRNEKRASMQIQKIQNNNYNTGFKQKLIFDTRLITRATREEKSELVLLKKLFQNNGQKGEVEVKNNSKMTVKDIIESLRFELDKKYMRKK